MKEIIIIFGVFSIINTVFGQHPKYNAVVKQLLTIGELDQQYRNQIDYIETKYGKKSQEINTLYAKIHETDSINLIEVEGIIKKYGWLGYNEIGNEANSALFMVIQHSNLKTWKKYMPIMKEAVRNGRAKAKELALLEDRLNVFEGKKQNYGSQIFWSFLKNKYFVLPLNDPDNVDKRRADVGLSPLAEYVSNWNIQWNVEEYKKDLPQIVEEWKKYFGK